MPMAKFNSKPFQGAMKRRAKSYLLAIAFAGFSGLLVSLSSPTAQAATVTVTTAGDDITPNDGTVSLREAITAVDAGNNLGDPDITAQNPGTFGTNDTINFNIAGAGVKTVNVGASASA